MQNLDSYLKDVARFLPAADRDDIVRELAENLRSQIEDREAEIGRPLTEAEGMALLDRFGTPLEVAARYRPASGVLAFGPVLVGPVLFPFYAKMLAFLLSVTACAIVVIGVALRTPAGSVVQALLIHLAIQFSIVTLIFSIAQVSLARRPRLFDVSSTLRYIAPRDTPAVPRVSRLESGSEIVLLAILLAWLPAFRGAALKWIGQAGLAPEPVWGQVYVAVACLWAAGIVLAAIALVRPEWIRFRSATRSVLDVAWLVIVGGLLTARAWVAPLGHAATPTLAGLHTAGIVNHWLFISLVIVAVVSAFQVLVDLRRLVSRA